MDIEILSDASSDEAEADDANKVAIETPPPTLSIGTVMRELPKIKNGETVFILFGWRLETQYNNNEGCPEKY